MKTSEQISELAAALAAAQGMMENAVMNRAQSAFQIKICRPGRHLRCRAQAAIRQRPRHRSDHRRRCLAYTAAAYVWPVDCQRASPADVRATAGDRLGTNLRAPLFALCPDRHCRRRGRRRQRRQPLQWQSRPNSWISEAANTAILTCTNGSTAGMTIGQTLRVPGSANSPRVNGLDELAPERFDAALELRQETARQVGQCSRAVKNGNKPAAGG